MAPRLVQAVIGVWLLAAPAVLGYGDPAAANDRIFGPIAGSLAFVALWAVVRPVRYGILPVGAWLVAAPIALGYSVASATINSVATGVILLALTPIGSADRNRFWGGWRSLVGPVPEHEQPSDRGRVGHRAATIASSTREEATTSTPDAEREPEGDDRERPDDPPSEDELSETLRQTGHQLAPEPSTVVAPSGERVAQPARDASESTAPHVRTAEELAASPGRPKPANQSEDITERHRHGDAREPDNDDG